jgi:hypothetical protein
MSEQQSQPKPAATIEDEDTFKKCMQRWIQLDVHVAKQNQAIKAIRDERTRLAPHILSYMATRNMQDTTINADTLGTITYSTETSYPSYTQKFVSESMLEFLGGDAERHAECMAFLKSRRKPVSHTALKRTVPKAN